MSEPYPLPSYAASIWTTGDTIHLALPATLGEAGHQVAVPNTPGGWIAINSILRDRERASRSERRIGTRGAPVQYDLDKMLKHMSVTKIPAVRKVKAGDDLTLEDLGL